MERFFEGFLYRPLGFILLPWQRKILRELYGTVDENGSRQYRQAYISVAKKQGKSFLCGGLPIYHMLMETEDYPCEAYGAAASKDQAGVVYKSCLHLVRSNPVLMQRLKILESTKRIIRRDGGGSYVVLSADGDVQDGIEPSLAIIDELHRWRPKRAETLHNVITRGTISRRQPMVIQVTTAGEEHECPLWFSEHEYARHILDGSLRSDSYYAAIWSADPKRIESEPDYWKSREARVAANPSHEDNGGFLKDARLVEELEKAIAKPETRPDFLRYHLNVPVAKGQSPVIDMPLWCSGGGEVDLRHWPHYDVDLLIRDWQLIDRRCYLGIDLAWTTDMTSLVALFPPCEKDKFWRVLPFYWLPSERIPDLERRTRAELSLWVKRGFLEACPGEAMGTDVVKDKVRWASQLFDVREITFDPYGGMRDAARDLNDKYGYVTVEIRQGTLTLSEPTKKFLELYRTKMLAHGNHPILNWNVSCFSIEGANDLIKPCKPERDKASMRIDGVSATIDALSRAMLMDDRITFTGVRSVG